MEYDVDFTNYEDYEDYDGGLDDNFEYDDFDMDYTLSDLWDDCLKPTVSDGFSSTVPLLICCLLMKLTMSLHFLPDYVIHLTSTFSGIYCIHTFFGNDIKYIILFAVIGFVVLFISNKILKRYKPVICVATCFLFIIICELFVVEQTIWHRVRGSQMVLAMKLISVAFDCNSGSKEFPKLIPFLGYLFNPGTVVFGSWICYTTYCNSLHNQKVDLLWVLRVIHKLLTCYAFLTLSTCWTSWFLSSTSWKWVGAYRDALSFRSSHYFVSYLSEATLIMSGVGHVSVASAVDIEFPRSLVEVVINWNFPMHFWLKTYVFKTTKHLGNFNAVLITYATSSLLHGLNFQLAAVLLSLGFYTYIEHAFRMKCAEAFSCCILARKCKSECIHRYKSNCYSVMAVNFMFSALSVFHLAYLGVMFDSSSNLEEEGYSMEHTLQKWYELDFVSHWIAASMYFINFFI